MILRTALTIALLPALAAGQAGSYKTFGAGCYGSEITGFVVPKAAVSAWGISQNALPLGRFQCRLQQEIENSELPVNKQLWTHLALREDQSWPSNKGQEIDLELRIGTTTYGNGTLTSAFATNATGKQTKVFSGKVFLPAVPTGTNDLKRFHYVISFGQPDLYLPLKATENLLLDFKNGSAYAPLRFPDAWQGAGAGGGRVWAISTTATVGTVYKDYNFVAMLGRGHIPDLNNTGVPTVGRSFTLDLVEATPSSVAAVVFGNSTSAWGPIALPHDLAWAGAPGCSVFVAQDVLWTVLTDATGQATVPVLVPGDPGLVGVDFHNQFLVLDGIANRLGLTFSNGGTGKVGR